MGEKAVVGIFEVANKGNLIRELLDLAMKRKL